MYIKGAFAPKRTDANPSQNIPKNERKNTSKLTLRDHNYRDSKTRQRHIFLTCLQTVLTQKLLQKWLKAEL